MVVPKINHVTATTISTETQNRKTKGERRGQNSVGSDILAS